MKHSKFSALDFVLADMAYMAGYLRVQHQLGQPTTYSLATDRMSNWLTQVQNYAHLSDQHPVRKRYSPAYVERTLATLGINPILAKPL